MQTWSTEECIKFNHIGYRIGFIRTSTSILIWIYWYSSSCVKQYIEQLAESQILKSEYQSHWEPEHQVYGVGSSHRCRCRCKTTCACCSSSGKGWGCPTIHTTLLDSQGQWFVLAVLGSGALIFLACGWNNDISYDCYLGSFPPLVGMVKFVDLRLHGHVCAVDSICKAHVLAHHGTFPILIYPLHLKITLFH